MSKHFNLSHRSIHFFKGVGYGALSVTSLAASVVLFGAATSSAGTGVGIPLAILFYMAAAAGAVFSVSTGANAAVQFAHAFDGDHYSFSHS